MDGVGWRRLVSVLAGGWGLAVAVVCGTFLLAPPLSERLAVPETAERSADKPIGWLVFALAISIGEVAAVLLTWAATRGYRSARDPVSWCRWQRPALCACGIGALLAIGCALTANSPWTGMPAVARYDGFLALALHSAVALLIMTTLAYETNTHLPRTVRSGLRVDPSPLPVDPAHGAGNDP